MLIEVAVEGFLELGDLGAHPAARQLGQDLGVAFTGDQRGHHRPPGSPENVGGHHRQLDTGVFEKLFHPVLLRGAGSHQIRAVARQIPQPPNRCWGHETGPQHLALGQLAQPHRIDHVGLGPARQVFDIAGR